MRYNGVNQYCSERVVHKHAWWVDFINAYEACLESRYVQLFSRLKVHLGDDVDQWHSGEVMVGNYLEQVWSADVDDIMNRFGDWFDKKDGMPLLDLMKVVVPIMWILTIPDDAVYVSPLNVVGDERSIVSLIIYVGKRARVTMTMQRQYYDNARSFGYVAVTWIVADDAYVEWEDQDNSFDAMIITHQIYAGNRARWYMRERALLVGTAVRAVQMVSCGVNAVMRVIVNMVLEQDGVLAMFTYQDHRAPLSTSEVRLNTVLRGMQQVDYVGRIYIAVGAHGTHAKQLHRSLLLSEDARVNTHPTLEVLSHMVHCTHGACAYTITDEERWYMMSRGISSVLVDQLIEQAFLIE